jgi:hypothetical protein
MDIILNLECHIIVYYNHHIRDIQTSTCHISCYQYSTFFSFSELLKNLFPLSLVFISMNCFNKWNFHTLAKTCIQSVNSNFGLAKYYCLLVGVFFKYFTANSHFFLFITHYDFLVYWNISFNGCTTNLYMNWLQFLVTVSWSEILKFWRPSCWKHQCLPIRSYLVKN